MQQRAKVPIDIYDDDDDDDNDDNAVKQEITGTIEKFVQSRHVQTLKYLQHVIDENRHLRLHIEHLKRRQDDPVQSPANIDLIDPEEPSASEIPQRLLETPETPLIELEIIRVDEATNTEGEDFEAKYNALHEEFLNVKKQHEINRQEFQRELERVDSINHQLEKTLKSAHEQIMTIQKRDNDKQKEIQTLMVFLTDEKRNNEKLNVRIEKLEDTNRILTQTLNTSEQNRVNVEHQLEQLKHKLQQTEQKSFDLQIKCNNNEKEYEILQKEIELLKENLHMEANKCQELSDDNEELRETNQQLQHEIHEKVLQEQQYMKEKQANSNFKDFVQVKRNLHATQQENEQLKIELKKLQIKFLNKNE